MSYANKTCARQKMDKDYWTLCDLLAYFHVHYHYLHAETSLDVWM